MPPKKKLKRARIAFGVRVTCVASHVKALSSEEVDIDKLFGTGMGGTKMWGTVCSKKAVGAQLWEVRFDLLAPPWKPVVCNRAKHLTTYSTAAIATCDAADSPLCKILPFPTIDANATTTENSDAAAAPNAADVAVQLPPNPAVNPKDPKVLEMWQRFCSVMENMTPGQSIDIHGIDINATTPVNATPGTTCADSEPAAAPNPPGIGACLCNMWAEDDGAHNDGAQNDWRYSFDAAVERSDPFEDGDEHSDWHAHNIRAGQHPRHMWM